MRSNCDHSFGYPRFGLVQLCGSCSERGRYVPAIFWAFASLQLMTSLAASRTIANVNPPGHSTNYGSGHLIRVFRDIGRIFSLLVFLSACWSPAESKGSNAEDEIWFRGRQKRFQSCFVRNSPGWKSRGVQTRTPPDSQGRGLGNPSCTGYEATVGGLR